MVNPNNWDHSFRPRVRNRPIPVVHGLDVLRWIVLFVLVTGILLYAMAGY